MSNRGGRRGPRDSGTDLQDEDDDQDDRTVPRWMGRGAGSGDAAEAVARADGSEPGLRAGEPVSADDAESDDDEDDRTVPRYMGRDEASAAAGADAKPDLALEPIELPEPEPEPEPEQALEFRSRPASKPGQKPAEEDQDDRTVPRWVKGPPEQLPTADLDAAAVDAQLRPELLAADPGPTPDARAPALDEGDASAAGEDGSFAEGGYGAEDAPELDATERLRRYRVRRADGEYQFVTREELDALNVERKLRAARHEADARRRHRIAMAIAGVSAALVVVVLVRTVLPGLDLGGEPAAAAPAPVIARDPAPAAAVATAGAAPADVVAGTVVREESAGGENAGAPDSGTADAVARVVASAESVAEPAAASVEDGTLEAPGVAADAPVAVVGDEAEVMRRITPSYASAEPVVTAAPAAAEPLVAAEPPVTALPPPPEPSVVGEGLAEEVEVVLQRWVDAWRNQDVDGYLASYAADFSRSGLSPEAWARSRRNRLTSVPSIEISISDIEVREMGPNDARAEFVQRYRDARYADESIKVVLLQRMDGELRIVGETDRVIRR